MDEGKNPPKVRLVGGRDLPSAAAVGANKVEPPLPHLRVNNVRQDDDEGMGDAPNLYVGSLFDRPTNEALESARIDQTARALRTSRGLDQFLRDHPEATVSSDLMLQFGPQACIGLLRRRILQRLSGAEDIRRILQPALGEIFESTFEREVMATPVFQTLFAEVAAYVGRLVDAAGEVAGPNYQVRIHLWRAVLQATFLGGLAGAEGAAEAARFFPDRRLPDEALLIDRADDARKQGLYYGPGDLAVLDEAERRFTVRLGTLREVPPPLPKEGEVYVEQRSPGKLAPGGDVRCIVQEEVTWISLTDITSALGLDWRLRVPMAASLSEKTRPHAVGKCGPTRLRFVTDDEFLLALGALPVDASDKDRHRALFAQAFEWCRVAEAERLERRLARKSEELRRAEARLGRVLAVAFKSRKNRASDRKACARATSLVAAERIESDKRAEGIVQHAARLLSSRDRDLQSLREKVATLEALNSEQAREIEGLKAKLRAVSDALA